MVQKRLKVNSFGKNTAFTLAEVLITLGIIGVVAGITIPTLISDYQKDQTATQLKKTYSTINQAYNFSVKDNGPISGWNWSSATSIVETYILPYLSVAQNCGYNLSDNCKPNYQYNLDKSNSSYISIPTYNIILNDGTQWMFRINGAITFDIIVDLNGKKGPNTLGKDVFVLRSSLDEYYPQDRVFFIGSVTNTRTGQLNNATYGCNKTATSQAGLFCGALIQQDNWQIKSDYPWN